MLKQKLTGIAAVLCGIGMIAATGDGTLSVFLFVVGFGAIFSREKIERGY